MAQDHVPDDEGTQKDEMQSRGTLASWLRTTYDSVTACLLNTYTVPIRTWPSTLTQNVGCASIQKVT